jgi:pyridoxal phosphate enzyme (YggS family)
MSINTELYNRLITELSGKATLIAVSKTKPVEDIRALYDLGQRDFGENYVQELVEKHMLLPDDIRWHFIGHLQRNKVKYLAPFVHLIHGVDSWELLKEVDRQAAKHNRVIDCLLQVHIATEETKFGFDEQELAQTGDPHSFKHTRVKGLMGMASFSEDKALVRKEFSLLRSLFDANPGYTVLSMGMSGDYPLALEAGSNMVRIGSLLFGERNNTH